MKLSHKTRALVCGLAIAILQVPGTASAITLKTVVAPIYQMYGGSIVNIGHTVLASTSYNRLTAGGTFSAACGAQGVLPVTGGRTMSTENVWGGLSLTVTIPEFRPAMVSMPGYYEAATRGATLHCAYYWTSKAVEGGFSVGAGGVSFQTGNGEMGESGTKNFLMSVPSLSDPNDNSTCIP